MSKQYNLTNEDLEFVNQLRRDLNKVMRGSPLAAGEEHVYQASHTYVARTPEGGIPALTENTEVLTDDAPGYADCTIWRISWDSEELEPYTGLEKTVYNVSTTDVPENTWIVITKTKSGHWVTPISESTNTKIARTPEGGIPLLDDNDTDGTLIDDEPGSATCDTYYIDEVSGLMVATGESETVYNVGEFDVDEHMWIVICKTSSGNWVVVYPQQPSIRCNALLYEELLSTDTEGDVDNVTAIRGKDPTDNAGEVLTPVYNPWGLEGPDNAKCKIEFNYALDRWEFVMIEGEGRARFIRFTLTSDFSVSGIFPSETRSASADVDSYFHGSDPGATEIIYDMGGTQSPGATTKWQFSRAISGCRGLAVWDDELGIYQAVNCQQVANMCLANLNIVSNGSNGMIVRATDDTFDARVITEIGGTWDISPRYTAYDPESGTGVGVQNRHPGAGHGDNNVGYTMRQHDHVLLVWHEEYIDGSTVDEGWFVLQHLSNGGIAYMKATADWTDPYGGAIIQFREPQVTCQISDRLGNNIEDEFGTAEIGVTLPRRRADRDEDFDPDIYEDDVIACYTAEGGSGGWRCLTPYLNSKIGDIVMTSKTNGILPKGWDWCDGSNGTIDMQSRFPMCIGDPAPAANTPSDELTVAGPNSLSNRSHGAGTNDHDTHTEHTTHTHDAHGTVEAEEPLGTAPTLTVLTNTNNHNDNVSGTTDTQHAQHTTSDNRPPFYVLRFRQRYK